MSRQFISAKFRDIALQLQLQRTSPTRCSTQGDKEDDDCGYLELPAPPGGAVKQPIVGYHKDEEGQWVAELRCGHGQHVRHDPPWQLRPWVVTAEGRSAHIGMELDCVLCDRGAP